MFHADCVDFAVQQGWINYQVRGSVFTPIKKVTKTLLNLGFEEEYGNDLNQKHVVNFSYLLFCATNVLMLVLFVPREVHSRVKLSA